MMIPSLIIGDVQPHVLVIARAPSLQEEEGKIRASSYLEVSTYLGSGQRSVSILS